MKKIDAINLTGDYINYQKSPKNIFPSVVHQNFGLTQNQFELVVENLKSGDESLFEKIFLSHFEYCIDFMKRTYKLSHEIAYDYVMDTLIEFRYKLLTDKIIYGNLRYLFTRMAGQSYVKSLAKENKLKDFFSISPDEEEDFEDKLYSLKNAWQELTFEEKKLLENFYYLDIPLNKIASVSNKPDATLRKQKQRALEKLRSIFFKNYNL